MTTPLHGLHRPSRWPHVALEAGPSIAGVEVGDMLPVDLGAVVYLWAHRWSPFPAMEPAAVSRPALHVRVTDRADHNGPAWRVLDDPPRVERTETATVPESWIVDEPSVTSVRGPRGVPTQVSKWRLRFLLDGPPLATVRTFGEYIACRPRLLGTNDGGTIARSEWLVANARGRDVLVVEQTFDAGLVWRTQPRAVGVPVGQLRFAVPHEHKVLDKEIAAGIAAQMSASPGDTVVGFDGVVRAPPAKASAPQWRVQGYLAMTRDEGNAVDDDKLTKAARELASITPASIDQIAATMRALFPEQAAREAALVEECAVLAG